MFFLDMKTPGIEVRPIKQMSGGADFNEVFFTDVRIPDSQRLGEVGEGWKAALTTLMNERLAVGGRRAASTSTSSWSWPATPSSRTARRSRTSGARASSPTGTSSRRA